MTEREKESSSAAVKRPQQPKEILEDIEEECQVDELSGVEGEKPPALIWARLKRTGAHSKCQNDRAVATGKIQRSFPHLPHTSPMQLQPKEHPPHTHTLLRIAPLL